MSTVETITQSIPETLTLQPSIQSPDNNGQDQQSQSQREESYRYAHLLPAFPRDEHFPPLTPFEHVDPAARALTHPNPRAFLDGATSVVELTPNLGTEVRGVNLATLSSEGRDQLALEVSYLKVRLREICLI